MSERDVFLSRSVRERVIVAVDRTRFVPPHSA